jgi:hypothetical protein
MRYYLGEREVTPVRTLNLSQADVGRVFECPACKETINTSASQCPFCSAPVDSGMAELAADLMGKVNQACSDASYLRITAGTMLAVAALTGLGIIPLVGYAFLFLLVAIPVMAIRWRVRFGGVRTDDADFRAARKAPMVAMGLWALSFVVFGVVSAIVGSVVR